MNNNPSLKKSQPEYIHQNNISNPYIEQDKNRRWLIKQDVQNQLNERDDIYGYAVQLDSGKLEIWAKENFNNNLDKDFVIIYMCKPDIIEEDFRI